MALYKPIKTTGRKLTICFLLLLAFETLTPNLVFGHTNQNTLRKVVVAAEETRQALNEKLQELWIDTQWQQGTDNPYLWKRAAHHKSIVRVCVIIQKNPSWFTLLMYQGHVKAVLLSTLRHESHWTFSKRTFLMQSSNLKRKRSSRSDFVLVSTWYYRAKIEKGIYEEFLSSCGIPKQFELMFPER